MVSEKAARSRSAARLVVGGGSLMRSSTGTGMPTTSTPGFGPMPSGGGGRGLRATCSAPWRSINSAIKSPSAASTSISSATNSARGRPSASTASIELARPRERLAPTGRLRIRRPRARSRRLWNRRPSRCSRNGIAQRRESIVRRVKAKSKPIREQRREGATHGRI